MKQPNELNTYIAFHVFTDSSVETSLRFIENTMNEIFKNESSLIVESENDNGYEVIYRIQQPLLVSNKDNEVFFNKLRKLFNETNDMLPHFTQVSDEEELMKKE